jgi:phosphoribosylanthranilate isomerase
MIEGISIKVCGLTRLADAESAAAGGADFLGFNFYRQSPREIPLARYRAMKGHLPKIPKVAIAVEPSAAELQSLADEGLDHFQVHFRHDIPVAEIEGWARAVGPSRLWLAPKLPPSVDVPRGLIPLARVVLLDTFDKALFGGTGRTGDWPKFRKHLKGHPGITWVLSGGLNAENVAAALMETGARFVDVNSGIESSPGIKDAARLAAFADAVRGASHP